MVTEKLTSGLNRGEVPADGKLVKEAVRLLVSTIAQDTVAARAMLMVALPRWRLAPEDPPTTQPCCARAWASCARRWVTTRMPLEPTTVLPFCHHHVCPQRLRVCNEDVTSPVSLRVSED